MNWKEELARLEKKEEWDKAICFMQNVVKDEPNNLDAYLFMNFLLMNLLVEEDYDESKHDYYAHLLKDYFLESYSKFAHDPEYLFFTSITAYMSEWYFDIELENAKEMMDKALQLAPENPVYQWAYFSCLDLTDPKNIKKYIPYAQLVLQKDSPIKSLLQLKGALGEYLLDIMANYSIKAFKVNYYEITND